MSVRIGLDIGSTTIKCAVLDENNKLLYQSYHRHMAMVKEKALELLETIQREVVGDEPVQLAITGSAGMGVAQISNIPFVQEVYATQVAVRTFLPDTDVVVELGGEDAKILFLTGGTEVRMNGSCAGGTGAFIDQMATLLHVDLDELDELSLQHEKIYTIASRCGVFAKSDIQPLLNQGARKTDIAASIFQSVVNQTISGLAQGRKIQGNVVFLGGPLTFFKGLRERFVETLNLPNPPTFPENSQYYIAMGAALYAGGVTPMTVSEAIENIRTAKMKASIHTIDPLFESQEEYDEFLAKHASADLPLADISTYRGKAYLGVDAGSTTTKMVLLSENNEILYSKYSSNSGNPVPVVKEALEEIYSKIGDRITIASSAVTGYGEELIQNAFSMDCGLVETVAHYTAAAHFMPEVDFIIDIGGQDIKCFRIRQQAIDSIMLNEACSSGCGSFIQTFASALGYDVAEFAKLGVLAEHPSDLGSRCTVFMNSSVKQAQKDGATVGDISAGLAISVVKNAIYKVLRVNSAQELGQHIVVQGGTFLNDAVLRAFEKEIGAEVVRPKIAGLMGAFGVALYAKKNEKPEGSTILNAEQLAELTHKVSVTTCNGCGNHCKLTINTFSGGRRYISGNKCERPLGHKTNTKSYNMYRFKYDTLTHINQNNPKGTRGRVGIPLGLNMYENLPFWNAFFSSLSFDVVLYPHSDRALYEKGQSSIPSDTVCYPAKLMHGQVKALLEEGVDMIFYPCMSYNFDEHLGDNHYNCPVVAYYPEVIGANVEELKQVKFINDYVGLHRPKDFAKHIYKILSRYYDVTHHEVQKAADAAYAAYEDYKKKIHAYANEAIAYAEKEGKEIIVLAGRPYHVDPEINHGIDLMLTGFDTVVLSEDVVAEPMNKDDIHVLNQWTYHSRLYAAAHAICDKPNMQLVQLVSFGCGLDAITTDEVREILESNGKLYTQIKIDEINNLGAVKIRLRSLFAALSEKRG